MIKPHRIQYYLEQRDPELEDKMREILLVYQDVALRNAKTADPTTPPAVITVSLDEKPGVQDEVTQQYLKRFQGREGAAPGRLLRQPTSARRPNDQP